jgi:hypothetical protein
MERRMKKSVRDPQDRGQESGVERTVESESDVRGAELGVESQLRYEAELREFEAWMCSDV